MYLPDRWDNRFGLLLVWVVEQLAAAAAAATRQLREHAAEVSELLAILPLPFSPGASVGWVDLLVITSSTVSGDFCIYISIKVTWNSYETTQCLLKICLAETKKFSDAIKITTILNKKIFFGIIKKIVKMPNQPTLVLSRPSSATHS